MPTNVSAAGSTAVTLEGTVTDANTGLPIAGVTVSEYLLTDTAVTDAAGKFTIKTSDSGRKYQQLVVSHAGYKDYTSVKYEVKKEGLVITADIKLEVVPTITHNVKVNEGTVENSSYDEGTNVKVTAKEAAAGKQFKEWTVVSGDVVFTDKTNPATEFVMPNTDVEITATYVDVATPPVPAPTNSPKTTTKSNATLYFSLIVLAGCVVGFGFKKNKI